MVEVAMAPTDEQVKTAKAKFPDMKYIGWKNHGFQFQGLIGVLLDSDLNEVYVRLDTYEVVL